jgi:hypothetical protein
MNFDKMVLIIIFSMCLNLLVCCVLACVFFSFARLTNGVGIKFLLEMSKGTLLVYNCTYDYFSVLPSQGKSNK